MEELVLIQNQQTITTSRKVASKFGKRHDNVMQVIMKIMTQVPENESALIFKESEYVDGSGKRNTEFIMNRDAFSLLVMGFTGEKAMRFKIEFINAFNRMEALIKQPKELSRKELLLLALKSEEEKEQALLQVDNLNTVLDNLLDWVSIIKVAQFNHVSEKNFNWRILKAKSEEMGYAIKKAESGRFMYQNLYNVNVFKACYPTYRYNFKASVVKV